MTTTGRKEHLPPNREIDQFVEAASCLDDRSPSPGSSCLTDVFRLSLDAAGTELMTKAATPRHASCADNEHDDDAPWGEVDPFAPRPRRKKTGGRQKGSLNKKTLQMRAALAALLLPGTDPRTFFATILKSKDAPLSLRFAAARELMPYMHPKLASVESRTGGRTHEDRLAEAHKMLSDD